MLTRNEIDFLGLSYPCLIIGPRGVPYPSAEVAWLARFARAGEESYALSVIPLEHLGSFLLEIGLLARIEYYPKDYWADTAYDIILQKYERPLFAKKLLQSQYSPENFPRIAYPNCSIATGFWYDSLPEEPHRDGHLRTITLQVRQELLEKYSQPLFAKTEIGKHIRAHNLAP